MGIKRLEDFNHDVEVAKELLSSMPINNIKNLTLYKNKVKEYKEEYTEYRDELYSELKRRSSQYLNFKPSERRETVKNELLGFKDLGLFNPINTPFEKMGFDTLLYSLTHYYKNDLASVNKEIMEAFSKFELVGITLTENDFVYSNYARKYIKELLKNDDIDRMKDVFEELHWKCPEVISHIETSLRILFDKNVKAFEKYIEERKKEVLLDNLSYDDFVLKRVNLSRELYNLENYEKDVIINKFMDGKLLFNEYTPVNINKCCSRFLGENYSQKAVIDKDNDFRNLLFNINEYEKYLKFSYVLDDIKAKYADRANHQGEVAKISKEISTLIEELSKLTSEINHGGKGFLFFKKKVDIEKNYLAINDKVKELDTKYEEYDKALLYENINTYITDTSSIYDVFRFVFSFKGYLRSCIKNHDEDVDINKVKSTVREFEDFLDNPNLNVLKNVVFGVDNDIAEIITDHYKLLEINVVKDELTVEGIADMRKALEVIINNNYLQKCDLSVNFMLDLFECKKIIEMYK